MPTIGAYVCSWAFVFLLAGFPALAQSANETSSSPSTPAPSRPTSHISGPSSPLAPSSTVAKPSSVAYPPETTCLYRTINYITHTLPQQCPTTSWSAHTPSVSTETLDANSTASPGETAQGSVSTGTASASINGGGPATTPTSESPALQGTGPTSVGSPTVHVDVEAETDSPLDNENFLSFEEWKKRNLAKAGQSPENVGHGRAAPKPNNKRKPVNVNALDSLGEDFEIEIDFGFGVSSGEEAVTASHPGRVDALAAPTDSENEGNKPSPGSWPLSKDAGKTCKERFNYASSDCAATVLKSNKEAKSSQKVLVENKDQYMLNECSAKNKFFIVELCDDILVDTVVLANFEFFSSMFRHFRVSVSDRYPVKLDRWRVLGTFEARNSRDIQPFLITAPQIWARYLRIEFLTHYGNEFYCPLSLLRVHGTTMMEQFKREEEAARGDDDFGEPIESIDGGPVVTAVGVTEDLNAPGVAAIPGPVEDARLDHQEKEDVVTDSKTPSDNISGSPPNPSPSSPSPGNASEERPQESAASEGTLQSNRAAVQDSKTGPEPLPLNTSVSTDRQGQGYHSEASTGNAQSGSDIVSSPTPATSLDAFEDKVNSPSGSNQPTGTAPKATNEPRKVSNGSSTNSTQPQPQQRTPTPAQPNAAIPSTQESFFKTLHKRLQQLEANSTLSLQYIEEQSRILRDAFAKVEKRQVAKTEKFLTALNETVVQRLDSYQTMYEQLWQSTIMALEGMKDRNQHEKEELGSRMSALADELVWQKRMAVVQSTLLLLCLGLVLFVKSGTLGAQLDMPIMQQLGSKYSRIFDTPPGTPDVHSSSQRRRGFRNMWRSDTSPYSERSVHLSDGINHTSDGETDGARSPVRIDFSPLTPSTIGTMPGDPHGSTLHSSHQADPDDAGDEEKDEYSSDLEADPDNDAERSRAVAATQSRPATPRGSRDSRPSWEEVDRAVDRLRAEEQGRGKKLDTVLERQRRHKRSPLRRAESYDGADEVEGEDAGILGDELCVAG